MAWQLGVRFDAAPLDYFWQYLDPTLLRDDLWASLYHLHAQPPAFNALLGLVLKLPGDPATSFALLYRGLGVATCVGVFVLASRLGMDRVRAGVLAALWAASPTAVVYESWLFYTHVVTALLLWGAVALHALIVRPRWPAALSLSLVVAAVATTRSLFHLVWAAGILGAALWWARRAHPEARSGRPVLGVAVAMAPALLLVFAVYAKNAALFGSAASSTWLGMSLAKVTTHRLDPAVREAMIESGELSPAARVRPFSPLNAYPLPLVAGPAAGHPALDRIVKPGNYTNFNHRAYVALGRLYRDDALVVMRTHPELWADSFGLALLRYAIPASQYSFVTANAAAYAPVRRVYELAGGVPEAWTGDRTREALGDPSYLLRRIPWLYWTLAGFAFGWAVVRIRVSPDPAARATLLYALVNIAWVALLANAVELGENQRFQVMVAPLQAVLIGTALDATWRGRRFLAKGSG